MVGLLGVCELVPLLVMAFVGGALADYLDRRLLVRGGEFALRRADGRPARQRPRRPAPPLAALRGGRAHRLRRRPATPRPRGDGAAPGEPGAAARHDGAAVAGHAGRPARRPGAGRPADLRRRPGLGVRVRPAHLRRLADLPDPGTRRPATAGRRPPVDRLRGHRPAVRRSPAPSCSARTWSTSTPCSSACRRRSTRSWPPQLGDARVLGLLYAAPAVGLAARHARLGLDRPGPPARPDGAASRPRSGASASSASACPTLLWLTLLCLAFAGARRHDLRHLPERSIWSQTIPDHLRGRLAGIEMLSYTTGPMLGQLRSGAMARTRLGVGGSIWLGGVLCIAGTAALAAALPRVRSATTARTAWPARRPPTRRG